MEVPTGNPMYMHDCNNCVFQGHVSGRDIYTCLHGSDATLVIRHSDEGHDYSSSSIMSNENRDLHNGIRIIEISDGLFLTVGLKRND